jgi:hypothetical protein
MMKSPGAGLRVSLTVALLLVAGIGSAAKTDEVVLSNGNAITGEVKSLQQGKLRYKTDHAGTLFIEWEHVHFVTSDQFFQVETQLGEFLYGNLAATAEARILQVVAEDGSHNDLAMDSVVEITPIEKTTWQRFDGSVDLGVNYASADNNFQYSLNAQATYTEEKYSGAVKLSSIETQRDGQEDIYRDSLEFNYTRYHRDRYFGVGFLSLSRNSELNLDLRSELGYALGRNRVITNRSLLAGAVGFTVSRENPSGDEDSSTAAWLVFKGRYHFYLYNFPETNILVELTVQPGISEWPRTRAELEASIRREIIEDFTISFSVYDSYDSEPPSSDESVTKHDYGGVLSIGWTF